MYEITWKDRGDRKSLKVSTIRAAQTVIDTLKQNEHRYTDLHMSFRAKPRIREHVIIFEK